MIPVYYELDLFRLAKKIKCNCCLSCRWADPKKSDRCLYGGPFIGYQTKELKSKEIS
jgi:hypothetical protein